MQYGGINIPGHTGTPQKNKKAFAHSKKHTANNGSTASSKPACAPLKKL